LSSAASFHHGIYQSALVRRITSWLDAMPHPHVALEVSSDRVAGARWTRGGSVDNFTVELLPPGALIPSAVESNIMNPAAVKAAFAKVVTQLRANGEDVALLLPDPVIRVFVQHFDEFPRSVEDAEPMLRWKLKKSVPFEADETVISFMRQPAREAGVDVVTALARQRVIREYEASAEAAGVYPGVVLSSALASVALLDEQKATLLARLSGVALTTVIVRGEVLCGYRSTELPAHSGDVTPQMLLDEIFPVTAYYQETWGEGIGSVRLSGLGVRLGEFAPLLEGEFQCPVRSLLNAAVSDGRLAADAQPLAERELDGLVGWMSRR
jgi:hypothetical protein